MSGFEVLDVIELDVLLELVDAHFEISNQKQSEWWSYLEVIKLFTTWVRSGGMKNRTQIFLCTCKHIIVDVPKNT